MPLKNRNILNPYFDENESSSHYKEGMLQAVNCLSDYLSKNEIEDLLKINYNYSQVHLMSQNTCKQYVSL
jgi:transposase-like protein